MMRKFLIGLLILGGVIAAIAVISRRRSGSGVDEWDSLATKATEATKDAATKAADPAKDTAKKVTDAAKDTATKVTDAAKDTAKKVTDAAKDA
jgi:uncharacterized protein (UPF0333 family)